VLAVVGDLATGGQTMIIVTHETSFVRRVAHRVHVVAEGRIVESGTPADVLDGPRAPETRAWLGLA
jgi:polar amino acid transport system ATP-binding protein